MLFKLEYYTAGKFYTIFTNKRSVAMRKYLTFKGMKSMENVRLTSIRDDAIKDVVKNGVKRDEQQK